MVETDAEQRKLKFRKALGALKTLLVEKKLEIKPDLNENFGYDFQHLFDEKSVKEEGETYFLSYKIKDESKGEE